MRSSSYLSQVKINGMENLIRVFVVEDDPEIRELMQFLIDSSPNYACPKAFESCEAALPEILEWQPDVVLMDIDLPGINGIKGVTRLQEQGYPGAILMLTVHEDEQAVFDALCAGAVGYLVKGLAPGKLLEAIREAYNGGAPMSPTIARMVVKTFHPKVKNPLSDREQEVLKLLCKGENYRTIAEQLFISTNTVKAHIKHIYSKLQVNSRAEAVSKAINDKLI